MTNPSLGIDFRPRHGDTHDERRSNIATRLRRVSIRDFQSLSDVALDLGALTVIVGRTNAGKSALIRAIDAALFNRSGAEFLREGATKATVTLDFEAGSLVWTKPRKGGAEYAVIPTDGVPTTVTRAGRELVPEIDALTGVREIETDGVRAKLQVAAQFDEPFLLSNTGGQAAKLLAHVSKLDVLVKAQVHAKQDLQRTRRRADDAEQQAEGLAAKVEAMPDYGALLERARDCQEQLDGLRRRQERLRLAAVLVEEVAKTTVLRDRWLEKRLPERIASLQASATRVTEATQVAGEVALASLRVGSAGRNLETARTRLAHTEAALSSALDKLEVCPICGRPMP